MLQSLPATHVNNTRLTCVETFHPFVNFLEAQAVSGLFNFRSAADVTKFYNLPCEEYLSVALLLWRIV